MAFFMDPEITLSVKLVEVLYMVIGLICLYCGGKNLLDKTNQKRVGTGVFWCVLGIIAMFGKWIPSRAVGVLVLIMCIPPVFRQVARGASAPVSEEYAQRSAQKIGVKLLIPAFCAGLFSLFFGLFTKISSLVGLLCGVLVGVVLLWVFNHENKPMVFLNDSKRFLDIVGPLSILPLLLACLGAVFTQAGIGEAISAIFGNIIPEGNLNVAILVLGLGMALFTAFMGNAFAAITVMMVGIGGPFILAQGANPVLIGSVALTAGFCGTLLTPMAANFNVVPAAVLEMKNKNGVIKQQAVIAFLMLAFQIGYMMLCK